MHDQQIPPDCHRALYSTNIGAFYPATRRLSGEESATLESAVQSIEKSAPDAIILMHPLQEADALAVGSELISRFPQIPVIFFSNEPTDELTSQAVHQGFCDILSTPVHPQEISRAVEAAMSRSQKLKEWIHLETNQDAKSLQNRIESLETLQSFSRQITSSLELDLILPVIVDAAVKLTGAEEGSLLLLDEVSGELYVRAEHNFQADIVQTFRLPVQDSLAGHVFRTNQPVLINQDAPFKILTSYLVRSLIYAPLAIQERVIGVLGVTQHEQTSGFTPEHLSMVSSLAEIAANAIEHARSYARAEQERKKLESLLTNIEEAIIVTDLDSRLLMVNRTARSAFGLQDDNISGRPIQDVFSHPDLLDLFSQEKKSSSYRAEIALEDGRIFNAQLTTIHELGYALVMQDITYLKELDRIKSDFVNTVSHDLRSPLTAILGYVELLDRVGPVNQQQSEFIRRVQFSVHNITALINDLLDLGRIEAGFDSRKEIIPPYIIIRYAIDGLKSRAEEKGQTLILDADSELPPTLGNPVRLRQMISNLIGNAIKYTPEGGEIRVQAKSEDGQIIIQVSDDGPGIPQSDQPYIFDKFYRGSNIQSDIPGTGLGLAIVKSIVENHLGRIWVDSAPNHGTVFTVVLPIVQSDL